MKKLFKIIPAVILSVFLFTNLCFATEATEPMPTADKTVTGAKLEIDNQYRFVKLGETLDLSTAKIGLTYYDGSNESVEFDESYLVDWQGEKIGRSLAKFKVNDIEFDEFFIVYDDTINALNFKDVYKTFWGYKSISRCAKSGIFNGMKKDEFGIEKEMTRAQFCQVVYRIYLNDSKVLTRHKPAQFTDVTTDAWYHEAVIACAESEIVKGQGNGIFNPDSPITRQDVAVIMMRILLGPDGADSVDVEKTLAKARESGIKALDFDDTANYAKKYVVSALGVLLSGDEKGNINPRKNITRSEGATIINNMFFDGFVEPQAKRLVYLSPSNQNSNQYAIYNRNDASTHTYTEGLQMQKIGDKVAELLKGMGYDVHIANFNLSIRGDEESRPVEANKMGADAYVAIHSNGIGSTNNGKYQGTICYYNGNNKGAKELSEFIYNRMSALTPTKDGGSRNDMTEKNPFTEVKNPKMANVLIEVEYHDYAEYATWIVTHIDEIAEAIALGIDEYLQTL